MSTDPAWFASDVGAFLKQSTASVLGRVAERSEFEITPSQRDAWVEEIDALRAALDGVEGWVFLEFVVPRLGSRIDAVVVAGAAVVVIEFKVGQEAHRRGDYNQVWDYALDLKNFHLASHHAPIVPILVATQATTSDSALSESAPDGVFRPVVSNVAGLQALVTLAARLPGTAIDPLFWEQSQYRPTPTIIEAAQALYARHSVESITRNDAGAQNLAQTSEYIETLIDSAKKQRRKIIAFVTGVPGAGKTLVGLNIATQRRDPLEPAHAVFLSGNGPLVAVLREALVRDEVARSAAEGIRLRKGVVGTKVKAFIQNVHHFRDDGLRSSAAPADHVVIFDEAQRAWNGAMTADFMARKKKRPGFTQSEPEFLISYVDRHTDWGVVVCLVGGGQEINRGEAGISAWLDAVRAGFPDWEVHISPELADSEYAAGSAIELLKGRSRLAFERSLHLATSMRSFRAEHVSRFVKALLDCDRSAARSTLQDVLARYPIAVTRDLDRAKDWVRLHARGSERFGLIASSAANRLKPHAIDVRFEVNPIHWFLNDSKDTRSSYYLEDAATEFQVQGLEVDWACVTWDADLRSGTSGWSHHAFRGDKWTNVKHPDRRQYLVNAYRVLLTRARQGMVIFVPPGDREDHTRRPEWYDQTFNYLRELGLPQLDA